MPAHPSHLAPQGRAAIQPTAPSEHGAAGKAYVSRRSAINHLFIAAILSLGLSASVQAAEDQLTIVAFGDSLTAGYGLATDDGFAPQLQTWLVENGVENVEVLNAGVSGDTTSAGLARLDWSVGPEADAVILELGANDMLRGVDPGIARRNLETILRRLGERDLPVLLAGMISLKNWGDAYAAEFDGMYAEMAEEHEALLYPFFLKDVVGVAELNLDDGLHPNKQGVRKLVENIGPMVLKLVERARADS